MIQSLHKQVGFIIRFALTYSVMTMRYFILRSNVAWCLASIDKGVCESFYKNNLMNSIEHLKDLKTHD